MRLDAIVHSLPRFYQWKLGALAVMKRGIYRVLGMDRRIYQLKQAIADQNNELIAKYVAGKRVLEIGCGRGTLLGSLATSHRCQCVGVDLSTEMIDYARKHNPGPSYQLMDSARLAFPDQHFDVVLFNYVLHHVKDLDATITEAKRVGKAIVLYESCACDDEPFKTLSKLYWKITDGGYQYLTLTEWQHRFGLSVLDEIRGAGLVRYGMCVLSLKGLD